MKAAFKTLGTVAQYINGRAFKPSEWEEKGLPIIRIQNLTDENARFNYSSVQHEEKYLVHNGDLLFAWAASLGAHIWKGQDAWLNQHIFRVIPNDDIRQDYLYYYLLYVIAELYAKSHGSGMVHITKAPFMSTPIPVPSLREQKHIVIHIEESFSELDAGVGALQKIKMQLSAYRQAVLKEAFKDNAEWEDTSFGTLMSTIRNGYGKKPDDEGDFRILRIGAVRAFSINLLDYRCNKTRFDSEDRIAENDLLFTRYNGSKEYVGVCACVPKLEEEYAYPDKLIKCTPRIQNGFHSKYLQYYISQGAARQYIRSKIKTTSGQNGISGSDIKKMRIRLPGMDEQKIIVENIEARLSACESINDTVDNALQQAEALRQSILKHAFEGGI